MTPSKRSSRRPATSGDKPSTRYVRRRRRAPRRDSRAEAETNEGRGSGSAPSSEPPGLSPAYDDSLLRLSRAPRPAEPPPKNPKVFSYTYTIWKTS